VGGNPVDEVNDWDNFEALDDFKVPKVRYVEVMAKPIERPWVRLTTDHLY
jgi:hypothetical protein